MGSGGKRWVWRFESGEQVERKREWEREREDGGRAEATVDQIFEAGRNPSSKGSHSQGKR